MVGMKFIIPLPRGYSVESEAVSSVKDTIRSSEYGIRYRSHVYRCVQKPITIAGETYTGHIFLNDHKQADSREAFLCRLLEAEALVGKQEFTQKVQMEDFLQDQLAGRPHSVFQYQEAGS